PIDPPAVFPCRRVHRLRTAAGPAAGRRHGRRRARGGAQGPPLWHARERLRPLSLHGVRGIPHRLLHLQEPLLPDLWPGTGGRSRCERPRAAPQRPAPPPHFLRAQRVATPPLSQPAAALGGGESSPAGYSHAGGDALPPAPAVAGDHGHSPHLRARSGGPRPRPPALYRRGAACRRGVAAGPTRPPSAI